MADTEDYSQAGSAEAHATTHENEGSDEISIEGLAGTSADLGTHAADATAHQDAPGLITTHAAVTDAHHAKYTDAEADARANVQIGTHAAIATAHQDAPGLITTHAAVTAAHHAKYTDAEADARADTKVSTHAAIATAHQDAPGLITTHAAVTDAHHAKYTDAEADARANVQIGTHAADATAHQDAPGLITTHAAVAAAHHARFTTAEAGEVADTQIFAADIVHDSLMDAKGDIIAASADNTPARLAVGTNDHVLTADSTQASGLIWKEASGSGDVTAAANVTDHAVVRGDGGSNGVQDSGVIIDDSDNITGIADLTAEGLEAAADAPEAIVNNTTASDAAESAGGRKTYQKFKGKRSGGEVVTQAYVEVGHEGTADDDKGLYRIRVNDNADNFPAILCGHNEGIVDFPNQSFARAKLTSPQTITKSCYVKLELSTEVDDVQGEYDHVTNYRFTAIRAGVYSMTANGFLDNLAATKSFGVFFKKNGAFAGNCEYENMGGAGGMPLCIASQEMLDANDYIEVYLWHNDGVDRVAAAYSHINNFSIAKIA